MTKYVLVLSEEADQDLDNLYEEGIVKWGNAQADKYYDCSGQVKPDTII